MRSALATLNEDWRKRGIEPLCFGVGINHGDAIVGSFGSEAKMEVSAIGDAVNIASRLEGVTKTFHIDLVIGEPVEPLIRDAFILRSVDWILLQGKTRPMKIFTVLAECTSAAPPSASQNTRKLSYFTGWEILQPRKPVGMKCWPLPPEINSRQFLSSAAAICVRILPQALGTACSR